MANPTDDELEAMAVTMADYCLHDVAAMLRACKGRGWQTMESAPIFGKVLRYDPRRREGEQVFECPADGGFWRHEKMPGMWMHMPEPPGSLEPAPDHAEKQAYIEGTQAGWNAAIEAGARELEKAIGKGVFIDKLPDHIRALAEKGPRHDT